MPGKPTEIRSYFLIGFTSSGRGDTNRNGDSGYGVATRNRSVSILPSASSADAFNPLPPMSMARVIGPLFFTETMPRRLCRDLEAGEHAVAHCRDQFLRHSLTAHELRV